MQKVLFCLCAIIILSLFQVQSVNAIDLTIASKSNYQIGASANTEKLILPNPINIKTYKKLARSYKRKSKKLSRDIKKKITKEEFILPNPFYESRKLSQDIKKVLKQEEFDIPNPLYLKKSKVIQGNTMNQTRGRRLVKGSESK